MVLIIYLMFSRLQTVKKVVSGGPLETHPPPPLQPLFPKPTLPPSFPSLLTPPIYPPDSRPLPLHPLVSSLPSPLPPTFTSSFPLPLPSPYSHLFRILNLLLILFLLLLFLFLYLTPFPTLFSPFFTSTSPQRLLSRLFLSLSQSLDNASVQVNLP